jgi:hypothetical protein
MMVNLHSNADLRNGSNSCVPKPWPHARAHVVSALGHALYAACCRHVCAGIFKSLSPHYAYYFFRDNGKAGWVNLSGLFLAVTGTEAIYADLARAWLSWHNLQSLPHAAPASAWRVEEAVGAPYLLVANGEHDALENRPGVGPAVVAAHVHMCVCVCVSLVGGGLHDTLDFALVKADGCTAGRSCTCGGVGQRAWVGSVSMRCMACVPCAGKPTLSVVHTHLL